MLDSVLAFSAVREIQQHVDGPNKMAVLVPEWGREWQERKGGSIGAPGNGFDVTNGAVFFEGDCRGTLVVRQFLTVRRKQAEGDAPFVFADLRLSPSEFCC